MFSFDDHTGNVVTTVALFLVAAAILYLARGAFFILLLSLLFAYLLEPAVAFMQRHSRLARKNRTRAIAEVYLIATLLVGMVIYELGPHLVAQLKNLNSAMPAILQGLSTGNAAADLESRHGLTAAQQQQLHEWLARHRDVIASVFERGAASAGYLAASVVWLFVIPILAIFILRDGPQMAEAFFDALERRGNRTALKQILPQVHGMLAKYIRAQFALAGLSFLFYSLSMLMLGFPYAVALGVLGGALEFIPALGWIVSAAAILTIGFLTHAHWIWMAGLLLLWRLVQDYVNSPHIMGHDLNLKPLTVLVALMVGGQLGGIAGVYLSVPTVAVLRIVWLECFSNPTSLTSVSQTCPCK